jgi:predicted NACHT family NTPase
VKDRFVNPLEGILDLELEDLFVEPYISDRSVYKRDEDAQLSTPLASILEEKSNVLFHGSKESGKTALLLHINEWELVARQHDDEVYIPIRIQFTNLSRHNVAGAIKVAHRKVEDLVDASEFKKLLRDGRVLLLIDDLAEREDEHRERRMEVFEEFLSEYPNTRVIATVYETVKPFDCPNLLRFEKLVSARNYYLWPFTIPKIRALLNRLAKASERHGGISLDVDRMVDQM